LLDTLGLLILYGCVAACLVEALLRIWRVRDPGERLALRGLSLVAPLLLPGVFYVLAPARSADAFGSTRALFAGDHWNQLAVGGVGVASLATVALAVAGALLYLRDAVPFLGDTVGGLADHDAIETHPALGPLRQLLDQLTPLVLAPPMALVLLDRAWPVLLCSGVDRPTLVISTGTLDRLDHDQLRAALTHELAHAARRDPLTSWLLMVVRTLAWFSPATQVVARQIVQELEYRADVAVAGVGDSLALGRTIAALADAPDTQSDLAAPRTPGALWRRMMARAERAAIGDRCEGVLTQPVPMRSGLGPLRVGLAGLGLALLLFFVV